MFLALAGVSSSQGMAQDLLNDNIVDSPFRLELRPYVTLPSSNDNIISITLMPGDIRPYVTTQQGQVFVIDDVRGVGSETEFFDFESALNDNGRDMNGSSGQGGLQSVAFHPDFNKVGQPGFGKLYTSYRENRPGSGSLNFLGNTTTSETRDSVLSEWTYDFNAQEVPSASFRELFRIKMPKVDHPIKQAKFNQYAIPGDDDYGMLYLTHGDSNVKHSPTDEPTRLDNALGKMLRINPLQSGGDPYTIPTSNPFASSVDPDVLKEIYAYGFRNPHTYFFSKDDQGEVHILVGDIGRNNVEEVNLVLPGANYGWTKREGTFVHKQLEDDFGEGYITGVDPLPANEATLQYTYPVAQYDHDAAVGQRSSNNAIATGFVIRNGSDPNLHNQFIFADFTDRDSYKKRELHTDFDEMLAAITQLDPNDPSRDEPVELTQAIIHSLQLSLDHDNSPNTAAQEYDDFLDLLSDSRADIRFGEGAYGEMYISSKRNGTIYLVTNSVPVPGDFDADGKVTGKDVLLWQQDFSEQGTESAADANRDDVVDELDLAIWKAHYGETWSAPLQVLATVPEPNCTVLMAMAIAGALAAKPRCFAFRTK